MKIALLTFHNAINYGAALQVYASQKAIQDLGVDCEIIDYVNEHRKNAYNTFEYAKKDLKEKKIVSSLKYFVGSLFMSSRRKKFLDFYNKNLVCTNKQFTSSEEAKSLNGSYDKFIVGSDQVWNYKNNGADFSYLLDFVEDDNQKISYSSSFGLASIPDNLKDKYVENLNKIKYLSTRENFGVILINDLVGRKAELVLDPVFLLDKNQWLSMCKKSEAKEKYIFAYTNRSEQLEDFLKRTSYPMANKKVYKISRHLTLQDFLSPQVKICYSISPVEFIETISNAELVVSASFHCIAMSIILNTPFIAVLTGDQGKDERVLNILKIAGLENRILTNSMTAADIVSPINYQLVEERVSKYIYSSREFLRHAIFTN